MIVKSTVVQDVMPCSLIDGANAAEEHAACAFGSEDGGYRFLYNVGRGADVLEKPVKFQCWLLEYYNINHLNAELNPICHLLALLGVHHFLHISRIRVNVFFIQNKTFLSQITFS